MRAVVILLLVVQGVAILSGCVAPTAGGAQGLRMSVDVTGSGDLLLRIEDPDGDELLREEREWSSAHTYTFETEVKEQGVHSVRLQVTRYTSGGVNNQNHSFPVDTRQCESGEVLVLHVRVGHEPEGMRCEAA